MLPQFVQSPLSIFFFLDFCVLGEEGGKGIFAFFFVDEDAFFGLIDLLSSKKKKKESAVDSAQPGEVKREGNRTILVL